MTERLEKERIPEGEACLSQQEGQAGGLEAIRSTLNKIQQREGRKPNHSTSTRL